jgi:hypothetical protein
MNIKNINKPTSPFWGKVIVSCATASAFIAGYGKWADNETMINIGGVLGILGTVLPVLLSNGNKE